MPQKIACIDLDGTICHYDEWKGESHFGELVDGAKRALKNLKTNDWLIIIYTTRSNKQLISNFLNKNDLPFDFVNENPNQPVNAKGGKPYADVYIDDRAIQFNGDWDNILKEIFSFEPWEKRQKIKYEQLKYAEDFLKHDFAQSYQQLRHYDKLSWDITKFSFVQLLVGVAATWTIYVFAKNPPNSNSFITENYTLVIPTVFFICYIFSILASFLLSRNRVYFSKTARYLNEHRQFSLATKPIGFMNTTRFYTNIKYPPAFDQWSTHLVSLYVIQIVSGIIFGAMIYCILVNLISSLFINYLISGILGIFSILINLYIYINYLKKQDKKNTSR